MPPSGSNPPQRKGWREASKPGRTAGAAVGPARSRGAGWTKKTADDRYESALLRHRLRLVFWSLLFLGLVGALGYYIFWRPVRTPFIAYAATSYAAPIPPNAFASEDLVGLRSLGSEGGLLEEKRIIDFREMPAWESKDKWLRELRRQIDTAVPGGPAKNAIIIYLSVHGVVDENGEPCLIPPGASPWQSSQWIRVGDVLNELFLFQDEKGRYATKIKGWDKLLVLDCNRIDVNWGLGQFYNGFAARLRDVVRKANVPKLYVLNSASPGQAAWSAPELHGSVFGYFLAQGLGGAADMESAGNHNNQVSLRELHGYLKANVDQWVIENRDDRQEPMLLPDDAPDVPLVYRGSNQATIIPKPAARDDRWDQVASLWQKHAQLRAKTPYRTKPMEWAAFQGDLLRSEQLLQAGGTYNREFNETVARLTSEAAALEHAAPATEATPYSLALAELWRPVSDREMRELPAPWLPRANPASRALGGRANSEDLIQLIQRSNSPFDAPVPAAMQAAADKPDGKSASSPSAKDAAKDAAAKDAPKDAAAAKSPAAASSPAPATAPAQRPHYAYSPAAAAAWKRALEHHDSADDLKQVLDFVDGADGQPRNDAGGGSLKADMAEVQFLRMLAAYLDTKVWDRPDLIGRALTARQLAETAIASPDLVTQYWLQNLVDAADADRRLAEDKLYVGSPDALKQAESLWESVAAGEGDGGKYREAIRRARVLTKALAVRDRAWAEAPYLAACILARLPAGKLDAADFRALLDATQKLSAILEDTPETDQWPAELPQTTTQVEDALKKLSAAYGDECYALRTAADDSHTLRRIAAVLAVPLVTGTERNALREKSLAIMTSRQSTATTTATRTATADLGGEWISRLEQWEKSDEHPALTLLDAGAMDPGEKKLAVNWPDDLNQRLAAQGDKVRARLDKVIGKAQQGVQETRVQLAKKRAARQAAIRQGCSGAERALRASAALFAGGPLQELQVDPIADLRRFDLRELLLWQARRTMEDFWGPKPGTAQPNGADKPYFAIVAADDLRGADRLQHSSDVPEGARLEQLTAAAENVVRPSVDPEKLLADDSVAEIPQTMTANVGASLPRGEAAVFLEYSRGPLPAMLRDNHLPWRRMPIDVQSPGPVRLPEYLIAKDWRTGSQWRAEAFYRGHINTAAFNFAPLRGVEIVSAPQPILPARISVLGESKQQTGLIFIFDCSGSMGEQVDKSNPSSPAKIDVARNALCSVLTTLAEESQACRAGMIVYGHRVWENAEGKIVIRNPKNLNELIPVGKLDPPDPKLTDLQPDLDIEELMLSDGVIAALSVKRADEIKARLDKLNNMGNTPLYRAIMQAVDLLDSDRLSVQKHIIVLTDGVNDQRHDNLRSTCEQLREKLNTAGNRGIKLDIVGFQIKIEELRENEKKEYEKMMGLVSELKRDGRGDFFDANDHDSVVAALRKSLALSKYEVFRAKSMIRVSKPLELNKVCEIKPLTPGPFHVQLLDATRPAAADVVLEGGEAIQLFLRKNPWGLVHRRYDREARDSCDRIADPADLDRAHWIGAHLPKWEAGAVDFYVSVQNGDATAFSPRPVEAWAEITQLPQPADASAAKKYVYYDMAFEPDRPVPVLQYRAPNWPKQAERARIELWCKFRPTIEEEVPLGKLKQFHVSDVPDVRFDVATVRGQGSAACKIVINEWHPKGADIYRLKLELAAGDAGPVEVHRLFDTQAGDLGLVRHEFYLDGNPSSSEIDGYTVRIVSRKRLQQGAVSLPHPLDVVIPP
jgi:hypothetical protein